MVNPHETAGFNIRFRPDENAPAGTEWHATAMVATMNSNEVLELPIRGRVADIF